MNAVHSVPLLYTISGFCVGLLVGLTGVGGGSLMTPLLILLFGVHPTTAVGTDLLYAAVTKSAGSAVHGFNRTVDWRIVGRLASGSVPMTIITIAGLSYFDIKGDGAKHLIGAVLAVALLFTAVTLIFRNKIAAYYAPRMSVLPPSRIAALTVLTGGVLGILVSITSVGAGAIGVTALVLLYPKVPIRQIIGSDIVHAVPLTLVAGIGHWLLGSVDWQIFIALIFGSIPGILVGSYAAARVPETALRIVLALTLLAVVAKLSFELIPSPELVAAQTVHH
ncbi:MAG: sulfite exporter TauE/SafE family protein [Xanthobacteraceae bacterium]